LPSLPPVALAELPESGPVSLEAAAPTGTWLAFCRQGAPALHAELAVGEKKSEAIDDLLAWDATGRWLVTRRAGVPTLLDAVTDARLDLRELGFDERDDVLDQRQHRALAFDPRGEVLAYVRRRSKTELVLRTLVTGEERSVAGFPGEPWRMKWDATGTTLVVSSIVRDSTGNGTLDFPVRLRKGPRLQCSGPLPKYRIGIEIGDRPTTVLVARDGTTATLADDFAVPFGSGFLARASDGSLRVVRGGSRLPLADAECLGRILFADPQRDLGLVSCTNDKPPPDALGMKPPKRVGVELVGVGYRQELGVVVQPMALDRWPEAPERLVALYPGSDTLLVDLDTRRTRLLRPGDRVLVTSGTRALVRREKSVLLVDATTGAETTLVSSTEPFAGLVVSGSLAAVGKTLLDAATGSVVGTLPGRPLLLTPNGDALVAEGGPPSADQFARAPLRWHRAAAPK
jgi:hypothetical protein